jgi:hypothetical protein
MIELPEGALRQYIDASSVFTAYEEATHEAGQVRGGMYWHKAPPGSASDSYLVRTTALGAETSLGPRSEKTEEIFAAFQERKKAASERVAGLKAAVETQRRLNRALQVGRVPTIIVHLLNKLSASSLDSHFRVVGTHALYAYESAAGVRFDQGAIATRDIDLLWDVRKRVSFATALARLDSSMLGLLRKVDPTFQIRNSQKYTAVNKDGFEVDIIRRPKSGDDPHPIRISEDEDDFWVAQAPRAQELLDAKPFSAVIVATNGEMARMNTLAPLDFARFKEWMSELPERDPLKRRRDILQAEAVTQVVREYLPQWDRQPAAGPR